MNEELNFQRSPDMNEAGIEKGWIFRGFSSDLATV